MWRKLSVLRIAFSSIEILSTKIRFILANFINKNHCRFDRTSKVCTICHLQRGKEHVRQRPLSWTRARSLMCMFNSSSKSVDTLRISAQSFSKSSFEVCVDVIVKLTKRNKMKWNDREKFKLRKSQSIAKSV